MLGGELMRLSQEVEGLRRSTDQQLDKVFYMYMMNQRRGKGRELRCVCVCVCCMRGRFERREEG